jgi:hypothetical protein
MNNKINNDIENFLNIEYNKICILNKKSSYRINDCGPPWIGALLSHLVHCMNISHYYGYTMGISKNDSWKMFPEGKFSDIFVSLSEVDDDSYQVNDFTSLNTRLSYNINRKNLDNHFSKNVAYYYPSELQNIINTNDKYLLNNIWKSFLLKKIYKLNKQFETEIFKRVSDINIPNNYAAIHIRRGDKVSGPLKESNIIPIQNYFSNLEKSNFKFDSIFISTDSLEALNECVKVYGSKYDLIYDKKEIRHDGYPLKILNNSLNLNDTSREELLTALKNFFILKNSVVLVGTPASWFYRISHLLRDYDKIADVIYSENLDNIPNYPNNYWHC